jgi:hypothetical protein
MPIAAIAFHNNFNLLADVRHDVRPLVCLFIKVFAILATPQPGFEPGTNRLTVDGSTAELLWNKFNYSFDIQVLPS